MNNQQSTSEPIETPDGAELTPESIIFCCGNHKPAHTASTRKEILQKTKKYGCRKWRVTGYVADEGRFVRRWHEPTPGIRTDKQYISADDLRILIARQLEGKLSGYFNLYTADDEYYCPPLLDAQQIIDASAADRHTWVEKRFDCDDFALILKAHFAEAAYADGKRRAAHCFGIVWGMLPGPHAINWLVDDTLRLRFVEPQTDRVFELGPEDKDIWFMLV